jgi:hypothetical protein
LEEKMLNQTIARDAATRVSAIQAEIEQDMAHGSCRHGNAPQAWDCWCGACEQEDYVPMGVYVRQIAIAHARKSAHRKAMEDFQARVQKTSGFALDMSDITFALACLSTDLVRAGYVRDAERLGEMVAFGAIRA